MIVNDNIKYIREISELTQAQFANVFRIPLSSLKNYENTDVMPKVELLNNLAKVLNLSVDVLVNRKLTSGDINWKRLDMEKIVRGDDELDQWVNATDSKSGDLKSAQEKYIELQNDYIAQLKKMSDQANDWKAIVDDIQKYRDIDMEFMRMKSDVTFQLTDKLLETALIELSKIDRHQKAFSHVVFEALARLEGKDTQFYKNEHHRIYITFPNRNVGDEIPPDET